MSPEPGFLPAADLLPLARLLPTDFFFALRREFLDLAKTRFPGGLFLGLLANTILPPEPSWESQGPSCLPDILLMAWETACMAIFRWGLAMAKPFLNRGDTN